MPFLSMARKDKAAANKDKSLPDPESGDGVTGEEGTSERLGTSGTEFGLIAKTREAGDNYKRAQQAEQTYKSKKRAADAKQHRKNIKIHFKQSAHHFKEFVKSIFKSIGAIPAVFKARSHERKAKAEEKRREKDMEKRKRLDERLRENQLSEAEKESAEE